jgi:repressor LexA
VTEIQYNNHRRAGGDKEMTEKQVKNARRIGESLIQARKQKKLTQLQVAQSAGLSRSYIADIEKDRYNPSVNAIIQLAKVLELDLNFLISDEKEE